MLLCDILLVEEYLSHLKHQQNGPKPVIHNVKARYVHGSRLRLTNLLGCGNQFSSTHDMQELGFIVSPPLLEACLGASSKGPEPELLYSFEALSLGNFGKEIFFAVHESEPADSPSYYGQKACLLGCSGGITLSGAMHSSRVLQQPVQGGTAEGSSEFLGDFLYRVEWKVARILNSSLPPQSHNQQGSVLADTKGGSWIVGKNAAGRTTYTRLSGRGGPSALRALAALQQTVQQPGIAKVLSFCPPCSHSLLTAGNTAPFSIQQAPCDD